MDNIELDELVYTYPEYDKEDIQTLITAKKEFSELAPLATEEVPKRGELFRHQKFFKRLMLQYDNQAVVWETGTGKGCGIFSVTEHYKSLAGALEEIRNSPHPPYKRAYVLVKGQTLIDELKFQLVCKCTDGDYITKQILNSKTESQRKANVTRSISKYYTIATYGTFAKPLLNLTDEQLRNEFDNSIFIVDEFHNLNDDKTGGVKRKDPQTGNEYYVKVDKDGKDTIIESRLIYDQLWRLFHTVRPRKVMLLSATPMINDPSELGPRLNLILPEDNQIPSSLNYRTVTLEELEPYFRGLISYVRALDTGAIPVYQGEVIEEEYFLTEEDQEEIKGGRLAKLKQAKEEGQEGILVKSQVVVYATEMSEKQGDVYQQAKDDPASLRPDSDKPEAFSDLERQVANFVFPDDTTGSLGYRKYVIENGNVFQATPELLAWISTEEGLRDLTAKFFEIVMKCRDEPGNCWCYLEYIRGSGAVVLGLCFEAQGFERFEEVYSVFSAEGTGGLAPLCGSKALTGEKKDRKIRISKKLRYGLLTSETSGPEASALLELFNSYENRHGEYIKAIIGSPVTRDGLNLGNVLQIHLGGPGWNEASKYQAISRAIRSTSHVDLIEEERQRLIREGKDPSTAQVIINVYQHAAVNEEGTSIDIEMYQLSEIKDREIKRIMRMMKQCAVDCQINYSRNVRPKDIDYSATCDYDVCQYKCVSPSPDFVDLTSYDVLYSGDVVEAAKLEIKDIFRVVFVLSFEDLYLELSDYRKKFIDLAVTELIEDKETITDRYGYISYLREDRGTIFLTREYPLRLIEKEGSAATSEYSSNLLGISTMSLNEYNGSIQIGKDKGILSILAGVKGDEFDEIIDNLTLENQILLLETAISSYYIDKIQTDEIIGVIDKFRNYIFIIFEPVESLKISADALANRGKGRGRKPKEGSKFKLTKTQEEKVIETLDIGGNEVIYFHNLTTATQALTAFAITAKSRKTEGQVRMLKESENVGWRNANPFEDPVYNSYIKIKLEETTAELSTKFQIYGTLMEDDNFRIIDKTTEDVSRSRKDARNINRGRICHNGWKKLELISLMGKINYNPFTIDIELNRNQLINFVVSQKLFSREEASMETDEKLKLYYAWLTSGVNRTRICDMLQEHFEETNRLFRT